VSTAPVDHILRFVDGSDKLHLSAVCRKLAGWG
jgi:hypothetical protein